MKINKKLIIQNICIFISLILGTFLWNYVELEFYQNGIKGIYSDNEHNGFNDFLRYVIFVSLPVLTYLILIFLSKNTFFDQLKFFFFTKPVVNKKKNIYLNFCLIAFILIVIFEFLSINFPTYKIDSYHDGQRLSSAYKSYLDGSLWSGSYITVGIIYETLSTKLIWHLFDHISIGLARYAEIFYILCLKISLIFLSYLVAIQTSLKPILKNFFFVISSSIFINIADYNITSTDLINFRDIPIIFITILFILSQLKNNSVFIIILIASLSVFSMLWGIDRGFVSNFLILILAINFLLQKEFNKFFFLIFFIFSFWITFYLSNETEFFFFIDNTFSILKEMNYIFGIIHPTPFSDEINASRATKTILLIILSLIISLRQIFKYEKLAPSFLDKFFLFLAITGAISYIYALGRSDGPHIKQIFGFQVIFFSFFLLNYFLSKTFYTKNIISKCIIIFTILTPIFIFINNTKINNVISFKKRFLDFIYLPDSNFITLEEKSFIDQIKKIDELGSCIDLFTYDAAILYLLRKPSCTKFYYSYSIGSIENQKKFINEIEKKTNYVISNGSLDFWDPPNEKYVIINQYLLDNFNLYINNGYHLLKKKN